MRIDINEIMDYEYVQRKMREHAQTLLKEAKRQQRPVRLVPQGISGTHIKNWKYLPQYGRLLQNSKFKTNN